MAFFDQTLTDQAVLWAPGAVDDHSRPTYPNAPVQVPCRWQDKNVVFVDRLGRTLVSTAIVYVNWDTANTLGMGDMGVLWYGLLADLISTTNPFANPGAWEIKKYRKSPGLMGIGGTLGEVFLGARG